MKNFYLVCYDISDPKRLHRIAKTMEDYGIRVLYSVFECLLTWKEFEEMRQKVETLMDPTEDKVRYYRLCPSCRRVYKHLGYGKRVKLQDDDTIII